MLQQSLTSRVLYIHLPLLHTDAGEEEYIESPYKGNLLSPTSASAWTYYCIRLPLPLHCAVALSCISSRAVEGGAPASSIHGIQNMTNLLCSPAP